VFGCELPSVLLVTRYDKFIKKLAYSLVVSQVVLLFFCTVIMFSCYRYGE